MPKITKTKSMVKPPDLESANDDSVASAMVRKMYKDLTYGSTTDVVFEFCQGDTSKKLFAHSNVLRLMSPVMKTLISEADDDTVRNKVTVKVPDVDPDDFEIFLQCLYGRRLPKDVESVMKVFQMASSFGVDELCLPCTDSYRKKIVPENAVQLYNLAKRLNSLELEIDLFAFFLREFVEVQKTDEFLDMGQELLQKLITSNDIKAPEEVIYDAVYKWIQHNLSQGSGVCEVITPQHPVVKSLMDLIRFPLLDTLFIATKVVPNNVLPDNDLVALYTWKTLQGQSSEGSPQLRFSSDPREPPWFPQQEGNDTSR